jgi:hypothetical protein
VKQRDSSATLSSSTHRCDPPVPDNGGLEGYHHLDGWSMQKKLLEVVSERRPVRLSPK